MATPHYDIERSDFELGDITRSVARHSELLTSEGLEIELVCGAEIRVSAGLMVLAENAERLVRLGIGAEKKYLLVDLPLFDMPVSTDDIFFHIQLCGMTPLLAHPERNRRLIKHPSLLKDMVERGIELQVNSGSLQGIYGKHAKRFATSLLREGGARLIASDAHRPSGRDPDLSRAAAIVERHLGGRAAQIMLQENPDRAIAGEALTAAVDAGAGGSKKIFFPGLFSRG